MCVANLNVSTLSCHHRWYTLVRPCTSTTNLSNCPEKLKLQGWESRQDSCPWCGDEESSNLDDATHRLFGASRARSDSTGTSPSADIRYRRASSATNSTTSLSRTESVEREDDEIRPGEKARLMNWRLDVYLMSNPDRKMSRAIVSEDDGESVCEVEPKRSGSVRRSGSMIGRKMKKSMRLGKTIFKG